MSASRRIAIAAAVLAAAAALAEDAGAQQLLHVPTVIVSPPPIRVAAAPSPGAVPSPYVPPLLVPLQWPMPNFAASPAP